MRRTHGVEGVHGVRGLSFYQPRPLERLERDLLTSITRPRLLPSVLPRPVMRVDLLPVEDRRLYHPLGRMRPALSVSGTPHTLTMPRATVQSRGIFLSPAVSFRAAPRVSICVRRKRRKEVIFALGRNGRGGSFRKPRRNSFSNVECR